MVTRRGFTLVEIVVAVIVLGLSASFLIPILINSIEQTKAHTAENNLLAIAAGEAKYYEDQGSYYSSSSVYPYNDLSGINAKFSLSMSTSDPFKYNCSTTTAPYQCVAWDVDASNNPITTLTFNPNVQPPVSCVSTSNNYCPS